MAIVLEGRVKRCYRCEKDRPLEDFGKNCSKSDGRADECKECKSELGKEYQKKNRDKIKVRKHEYYLGNRDKIIQKSCNWAKENRIEHNVRGKKAKEKLKLETFTEYCDDGVRCKSCGKSDIEILTVDHIDGNGAEHRREIGLAGMGGYNFYRWLKKNNYPDGFQILCFNCNFRKRNEQLKPKNPTHLQQVKAKYVRGVKLECLDNYGGYECTCGETDIEVLTLDHVNDDGAEHRRKTGTRGHNFYHMLRKNGFPNDPPLQVLCLNCQIKKRQRKYDEERESRQSNDCDDAAVIT